MKKNKIFQVLTMGMGVAMPETEKEIINTTTIRITYQLFDKPLKSNTTKSWGLHSCPIWICEFFAPKSYKLFWRYFSKTQKNSKTQKLKKKIKSNLLSFYNVVRNHKYSVLIQPSLKSLPLLPKSIKKKQIAFHSLIKFMKYNQLSLNSTT